MITEEAEGAETSRSRNAQNEKYEDDGHSHDFNEDDTDRDDVGRQQQLSANGMVIQQVNNQYRYHDESNGSADANVDKSRPGGDRQIRQTVKTNARPDDDQYDDDYDSEGNDGQ